MNKIVKASHVMHILTSIFMCLYVILGIYVAFNVNLATEVLVQHIGDLPTGAQLSNWQTRAIMLLAIINLLPIIYVLEQLRGLFDLYKNEVVFARANTKHIFNAGAGLLASAIIALLSGPIGSLILTAHTEHTVVVTINATMLTALVSGSTLTIIGWVMHEAAKLSEDNKGFI